MPISKEKFDALYAKGGSSAVNGFKDYDTYISGFNKTPTNPTDTTTEKPDTTYSKGDNVTATNITDYAGQTVASGGNNVVNKKSGTSVSSAISGQTANASQISPNDSRFSLGESPTVSANSVGNVEATETGTYNVATTKDQVANNQMGAAQGTVSQGAIIDANEVPQADTTGIATGTNRDGSDNELGKALQQYASVNISNVIDTSTSAGKLLAEKLGEGNYVDSKATLKGQLETLQAEFVDANGNPTIPSWAASTARNVSKIAAFGGMTGTAATAAMSQALLEASLPIAQADSQFFQTLTIKNLDNKQQATINAANVLAKFEEMNLDNRMTAAVQNAQSFLAMDMKNLDNKQQAAVINNQSMIQSILADANAKNVQSQFLISEQNDLDQFYASLNTSINTFNSNQTLEAEKFNASMEDSRDKFYSEQQYNIAVANANWRQQVQLQEDQQKYEAATTDVKNKLEISVNQLNQLWDRSDSLLDYAFTASQNDADRKNKITLATIAAKAEKAKAGGATTAALGSLAGTLLTSDTFTDWAGGLFS